MRADLTAKALPVSRPADARHVGPRATDAEIKAPLRLTQAPPSGVDGLTPLVLHASPDEPAQSDAPSNEDADALAAKKLKQERAKIKKERVKADKAKRPALKGERFFEAVARLKASASGEPSELFLILNDKGVWQLQDKPLSRAESLDQWRMVANALVDEVWFANLREPFRAQLAMAQAAQSMAHGLDWLQVPEKGGLTLHDVLLRAEIIAPALRCRTPEAFHAQWTASTQWQSLAAKNPEWAEIVAAATRCRTPEASSAPGTASTQPQSMIAEDVGLADRVFGLVDEFRDTLRRERLQRLCGFMAANLFHAFLAVSPGPSIETPPPRTRRDVERIFSQSMLSGRQHDPYQLLGLVRAMHGDASLSGHVLDFLPVLCSCATSEEEAVLLETIAVSLTISMSPRTLAQIYVTREQLEGIQGQVFILGGHIESLLPNAVPNGLNAFDPIEILELGKRFLRTDKNSEAVSKMQAATQILKISIDLREARIDRLVQIEAQLQRIDTDVSFEGLQLDALLDHFVPLQSPLVMSQSTQFQALTHLAEDAVPTGDMATPGTQQDEAAAVDDAEDSPEHWQQVWESFRVKNEQRHRETATARKASRADTQGADVDDESEAKRPATQAPDGASNFSVKQPGSRDHTDGRHGLPGKGLPNAVRKLRLAAIHDATRNGVHFTDDDRRKAWARLEAAGVAARRGVPEVD